MKKKNQDQLKVKVFSDFFSSRNQKKTELKRKRNAFKFHLNSCRSGADGWMCSQLMLLLLLLSVSRCEAFKAGHKAAHGTQRATRCCKPDVGHFGPAAKSLIINIFSNAFHSAYN